MPKSKYYNTDEMEANIDNAGPMVVDGMWHRWNAVTKRYESTGVRADIKLKAGATTTGAAGTPAEATVTGTNGDFTVNLKIPQGVQGVQGIQGVQGAKGDKGDTGSQGVQGVQGPQGVKGDKGDVGPQGVQGIKGDKGETGAIGPQGPAGNLGDIHGLAGKSAVAEADEIPIADSAGAWGSKKIAFSTLKSWLSGLFAGIAHKHVKADVTDFAHKTMHKTGGSDALSAADVGAFPATGGILDAHLTVNGFFSARTGMEVYGGTPFIDFHHNNSSADYTTRIIENTAGKLSISGSLEVAGEISVGRINMWSAYNAGIMQAYVGQCFRINNLTNTGFMPCEASGFFVNSSLRYKNILEGLSEEEALKILRVDAVRYQYKKERIDDGGKVHSGVIAEQVDEIGITDVITYDDQGRPDSVDYSKFVPYLIKLAQVQQEEIDRLSGRLDALGL